MIFQENKYTKWYFSIIYNARKQNRKKGDGIYYENHHIIPRGIGGKDNKENTVLFTAKEHYIAHCCLVKAIIPKYERSAKQALCKMQSFNTFQNGRSSLRYVLSRKLTTGKNHPLYGTKLSLEYRAKIKKNHWLNNGGSISETTKQIWRENRKGSGNSMYGKTHSQVTKQRISQAQRGKIINDDHKEKLRIASLTYCQNLTSEQRSVKFGSANGKKWFNDGISNYLGYPGTEPHGYKQGRVFVKNPNPHART